jgi:hypothetical protein
VRGKYIEKSSITLLLNINNMTIQEEYAILDAKIGELTARKESLRTKIVEDMVNKNERRINTPMGTFSISMLKKWTYPAKVTAIGEEFKAAQALAQSTGEATFEENPSMRFTKLEL